MNRRRKLIDILTEEVPQTGVYRIVRSLAYAAEFSGDKETARLLRLDAIKYQVPCPTTVPDTDVTHSAACLCVTPPLFGNDPEFCTPCSNARCIDDEPWTPCRVTGIVRRDYRDQVVPV